MSFTYNSVSKVLHAALPPCVLQVELGVQRETKPGQRVVLVGGHPALGSWDVTKAVSMSWSDGHVWKASIELPADTTDLQYKVSSKGVATATFSPSTPLTPAVDTSSQAVDPLMAASCTLGVFPSIIGCLCTHTVMPTVMS